MYFYIKDIQRSIWSLLILALFQSQLKISLPFKLCFWFIVCTKFILQSPFDFYYKKHTCQWNIPYIDINEKRLLHQFILFYPKNFARTKTHIVPRFKVGNVYILSSIKKNHDTLHSFFNVIIRGTFMSFSMLIPFDFQLLIMCGCTVIITIDILRK